MLGFLLRQFLPVGLLVVAVVGFFFPRPGLYMAELPTQYVAVGLIFFLSGLMLKTDEVHAALAAWKATSWGCVSILFATPFIGAAIAFQLPMEPAFQFGLALFCCMPTTLTSGVALTAQARGNVALALLLTVLTNIAGIFTVPFVLAHLLSSLGQVELSASDLFAKLCLSILLPLGVGKYLRRFAVDWIDAQRSQLTLASNAALISIPWMKFSESSGRLV
ncbi:MAG: bile acid:sodium symporter, partial [Gemmatimonadota bacterium]|nr:bile acid:sodium symporter [Gemmatimonadota bacterium]